MSKANEQIIILLVEDDPGHARLIEKNLRRADIANEILVFGNGQQVMDYLEGIKQHTPNMPHERLLMFLDLNMPVLDGYQVLQRVKADARTQHIPVVILTTTDDAIEIERCYALGANAYVTKPVDYAQFAEAIHKIGLFLTVVKIPGTNEKWKM